ncbi:MAG: hypothetical protein ABIH41_00735 [Nanoarchaeota archaeon]
MRLVTYECVRLLSQFGLDVPFGFIVSKDHRTSFRVADLKGDFDLWPLSADCEGPKRTGAPGLRDALHALFRTSAADEVFVQQAAPHHTDYVSLFVSSEHASIRAMRVEGARQATEAWRGRTLPPDVDALRFARSAPRRIGSVVKKVCELMRSMGVVHVDLLLDGSMVVGVRMSVDDLAASQTVYGAVRGRNVILEAGLRVMQSDGTVSLVTWGCGATVMAQDGLALFGLRPSVMIQVPRFCSAAHAAESIMLAYRSRESEAVLCALLLSNDHRAQVCKAVADAHRPFRRFQPLVMYLPGHRGDDVRPWFPSPIRLARSLHEAARMVGA